MRRLPPNVHELRGNPSKRRHLRGIAPEIPQNVPDPPAFLTAAAGEEWRRLAPELCRLGLLSALDTMPLAAYCQAFATWCAAAEAGAADGIAPDERRELARIARDSARDMVRYARAFGMTPSSRSAVTGGSRPDSKFDGLIG
jgi:P27 family predicted phage terminase small subunit